MLFPIYIIAVRSLIAFSSSSGVRMIEVVTREELEKAINDRTAMMFFLNSADPRGKVHHEEFVAIAKKHNVPTLIDAAADVPPVENLWRFTKMGFDLVGFSGGKGLRNRPGALWYSAHR